MNINLWDRRLAFHDRALRAVMGNCQDYIPKSSNYQLPITHYLFYINIAATTKLIKIAL